jgi:hypothetical protein
VLWCRRGDSCVACYAAFDSRYAQEKLVKDEVWPPGRSYGSLTPWIDANGARPLDIVR